MITSFSLNPNSLRSVHDQKTFNKPLSRFLLLLQFLAKAIVGLTSLHRLQVEHFFFEHFFLG